MSRADILLGLLGRFLFLLLQAGIRAAGKLTLELLDPTCCIDVLQLAGVERMTRITDIDLELFTCAASLKRIATAAGDGCLDVLGVDAVFHFAFPVPT